MATEVSSYLRGTQPYSCIGLILATFPDGTQAQGTCTLVGRNDILTATHVVYSPDNGGWATSFDFYFGADYNNITNRFEDYGYSYLDPGWKATAWPDQTFSDYNDNTLLSSETKFDVAMIGVADPIGDTLGWLGLDPGYNGSYSANSVGYPNGASGMVQETVYARRDSYYEIYETNYSTMGPGSSGGPLLIDDYVIGVMSGGGDNTASWADVGTVYSALTSFMDSNDSLLGAIANTTFTVVSNASTSATAVSEGSGVTFTITRSGSTAEPSTIYWGTQAGTASAGAGDYPNLGSTNSLYFAANETTKTVTINTSLDSAIEGVENFYLNVYPNLTDAENFDYSSRGIAYIKDTVADIPAPSPTIPITPTSSGTTKAKAILGSGGDQLTISLSGATVIGNSGSDTLKMAAGATDLRGDANIERLELPNTLSAYRFLVVPGIGLQIQDTVGTVVATFASINQTATLAFANGSAALMQTGGSAFSLGGFAVSSGTASAIAARLNTADPTTASNATSKAKIILGAGGDTFIVNNSGVSIVGNSGSDTLKIASGVTDVRTDGNIDRVEMPGALASYKFLTVPGTGVQMQNTSGGIVAMIPSLNQTATLVFADGATTLQQTGGTSFKLGGHIISTTTASSIAAVLNGGDKSTLGSGSPNPAVSISAAGSGVDGGSMTATTYSIATGTYTYSIAGFGREDVLRFFSNAAISVLRDTSDIDGIQSIQAVDATTGGAVTIVLTGLTAAQDAGVFNLPSFNTVFGAGALG